MTPYRIQSRSFSLGRPAIAPLPCSVQRVAVNEPPSIDEKGGFVMSDASDCLPDITLIDQHGQKVSLSSLRGKPVLFDFIYTTCPGPCLLLTSRMKAIAIQLGPALGKQARIVSITVDPEHDHPEAAPRICQGVWRRRQGMVIPDRHAEADRRGDGTVQAVSETRSRWNGRSCPRILPGRR